MQPDQVTRRSALPVNLDGLPRELRERPQWVCWHWEYRGDKWTKIPLDPASGRRAMADTPATWGSFERARSRYLADKLPGIGFVFSEGDPYAGIDLDGCRDPQTGAVAAWARAIMADLDGYADVSPSGTGIKIIVRAALPEGRGRRDSKRGIEMYDRRRYFTLTGVRP